MLRIILSLIAIVAVLITLIYGSLLAFGKIETHTFALTVGTSGSVASIVGLLAALTPPKVTFSSKNLDSSLLVDMASRFNELRIQHDKLQATTTELDQKRTEITKLENSREQLLEAARIAGRVVVLKGQVVSLHGQIMREVKKTAIPDLLEELDIARQNLLKYESDASTTIYADYIESLKDTLKETAQQSPNSTVTVRMQLPWGLDLLSVQLGAIDSVLTSAGRVFTRLIRK